MNIRVLQRPSEISSRIEKKKSSDLCGQSFLHRSICKYLLGETVSAVKAHL